MILNNFIRKPCPVCNDNVFILSYGRQYRECFISLIENNILEIKSDDDNIFTINLIDDTIIGNISSRRFRIMKDCHHSHYKVSTNYIERPFFIDGKLIVPDGLMYEDICVRFDDIQDKRVPEGGGSINLINDYHKNKTMLNTPDGWKSIPIIPLNRFDFSNPISVLNKLESLLILE